MWGRVSNRSEFIKKAIEFTGNYKLYGSFMDRVVNEWPVSCENALTDYYMNRKAWIDWNIDGDFDDPGEELGSESEASTLSWNTTFTVPSTAVEGATRLRVAANLGSMTNNSCGTRDYGEVEDYRVIIRPDGTPPEQRPLRLYGRQPGLLRHPHVTLGQLYLQRAGRRSPRQSRHSSGPGAHLHRLHGFTGAALGSVRGRPERPRSLKARAAAHH